MNNFPTLPAQLKLTQLYEDFARLLQWEWQGHSPSAEMTIDLTNWQTPLIQYYHPQRKALINLVGQKEQLLIFEHFCVTASTPSSSQNILFVICEPLIERQKWQTLCDKNPHWYVLTTSCPYATLMTHLWPYLQQYMTQIHLHGVLMDIFGKGVLLQGAPGIGKSRCALQLLSRGHRLIADDAPSFYALGNQVIGFCPAPLQQLIEVRGVGLMDVQQQWGPCASISQKALDLIIHFTDINNIPTHQARPLAPTFTDKKIFNTLIRSVTLPLAFTSDIAMLVENTVRLAFALKSPAVEKLNSPL